VGAVEFRTQDLWKVVINEHFVLSSSVAGSVLSGERFRHRVSYLTQILAVRNLILHVLHSRGTKTTGIL
jgi:hypothetical protein